ncbi:hypothetical protein ACFYOV_23830 [Streptomyces sp. NPDC005931]|uniref:hypothetical protein n=1 Tax=Streptomyces sp. NPDC005931 TaxID=3364737 RepID=UPI0036A38267
MPTSPSDRPPAPATVWQTRGRHAGTSAEDVLRRSLRRLKADQDIDDFLELPQAEGDAPDLVFEARTRVAGQVTVRARLSLAPAADDGQEWTLVAEAERPWDQAWPSPAAMFWPTEPGAEWNRDAVTGLCLGEVNPLPRDDKAARRLLRDCARSGWNVHVVVHEAMTTDERGQVPLAHWLPPGLRHRVVEHRAAPQQLRVLNWALRDFGVEVPRGGAVVLPGAPAPEGYDAGDFAVRAVFLDGSEPADLVGAVTRFAALPRALPDGAREALTALREDWHLLTPEEELARERRLVAMYAEALEAMTRSRDLYREAAERAHEALAAYRESAEAVVPHAQRPADRPASALQQLTRTLERLKPAPRPRRAHAPESPDAAAPTAPVEDAAPVAPEEAAEPRTVASER